MSGLSDTHRPEPGDNDPSVPLRVANYLSTLYYSAQGTLKIRYASLALGFHRQSESMHRGGRTTWWAGGQAADDMTYECDSKLGSPKVFDCTQVHSQLGATSDSVQVGAGEVKFLSSSKNANNYASTTISPRLTPTLDTCHVAISAVRAIVLTWAQIQAALDTLTNRCVSTLSNSPQGGRAFYGVQTAISGRRRKRGEDVHENGSRKRQSAVSGRSTTPLSAYFKPSLLTYTQRTQRPPPRR